MAKKPAPKPATKTALAIPPPQMKKGGAIKKK